jgi:hypothetical protein
MGSRSARCIQFAAFDGILICAPQVAYALKKAADPVSAVDKYVIMPEERMMKATAAGQFVRRCTTHALPTPPCLFGPR